MDTTRNLSYLFIILGVIVTVILSCFRLWSETIVTAYCIFSFSFLLYCISKQVCATRQNTILYEIMRSSKKIKKLILTSNKLEENNKVAAVYYDEEYSNKEKSKGVRGVADSSMNATKWAAATLFFDITPADALNKCCKPFYLRYKNYIKIDRYDGEYEKIILDNDYFTPGPNKETVYINGTATCVYDLYCQNVYYKGLMDSLWYLIGIIVLYILTRSILFTYHIMKTPVSTYTVEKVLPVLSIVKNKGNKSKSCTTTGSRPMHNDTEACYNELCEPRTEIKITRTNYQYCNIFRSFFIMLYLATFCTTIIWVVRLVRITPVNGLYINNESIITIYNETVDFYTYLDFLNNPNDLVMLNETNYEELIELHYGNTHYPNGTVKTTAGREDERREETEQDKDAQTETQEDGVMTRSKSVKRQKRSIYDDITNAIKNDERYSMASSAIPMSNYSCTYNSVKYVLTGVLEADCIYNSTMWGIILTRYPTKYQRIDSRCFEQLNIDQSRLGNPVCYKYCGTVVSNRKKVEVCEIKYDPNIVKMNANNMKPFRKNQREMLQQKLLFGKESTRVDKISLSYSNRVSRSISVLNNVNRYGVGTYVFEEWRTQFTNSNGAIFLAEFDNTDNDCLAKENNMGTYQAVCSHKRRQMISCEPNLWGSYSVDSNTFDCVVPTNFQLNSIMPNWRKTGITIPYSIPLENLAGEIPLYTETRNVRFRTSQSETVPLDLTIELLWGKKYQDNIQQIGGMKYFIYSCLFKITQENQQTQSRSFPQAFNRFIDYYNRWESRIFNDDYHMDRNFGITGGRLIPDIAANIVYLDTPSEFNMRQDRAYINFIFKSDVYDMNGRVVNPLVNGWDVSDPCLRGTSNVPCTWLVPLYYAIRVYGPALIDIKLFDRQLETIAFSNDVCSSVNAIKMRGVCYIIDHSTVSTDLVVGGYPWTNWSAMFTSEWNALPEFPSFYLNHPKTGSGQYMAQVSDAANIGFYSVNGRCADTYYKDGILMCDGNAAVNIRMVEYTTFHRPLLAVPSCRIHKNNTLDCQFSDPTRVRTCHLDPYGRSFDKNCNVNVTTRYLLDVTEATGYNIKTPITSYQVQRGYDVCLTDDCVGVYFKESSYRCLYCVIIICLVAGIGYVALVFHVLLCIICYINSYTLGRLGRFLRLKFLFKWYYTPVCSYCNMYMYNEMEKSKHDAMCPGNKCPYCVTVNPNNEVCILSFPNKTNFKMHMSLHRTIRRNPYIGYIKVRRNKVVTFTLVLLMSLGNNNNVYGQYFSSDTGLRSNKVGTNISIPEENVRCNTRGCQIISNYRANIPLTDGSQIVMHTTVDNIKYSKKITIENPHMHTSCDYLYSSPKIIVGNRRLVYTCLGKTTCNYDNKDSMILNPIAGKKGNEFVPMDPYNPLKSYYCPKAISCSSPIVDFFWLSAGCWTIDDGTAIGYEYYLPDVKDVMAHVFRCTINDVTYKVCEGTLCRSVDGGQSDIDGGEIHFEHVPGNLPVQFTIAATSAQGEDKPNHIFYNVPDNNANTDNTAFAMKMNQIAQGETCVDGTEYNGGVCEIDANGASPALNCKHFEPNMDDNHLIDNYQSLADVYHCNFEEAMLSWNTKIIYRSVTVAGTEHSDTQTVSWPSINLNNTNCNFGFIEADLISLNSVTLEQVKYEGHVKKVKCDGWYNRNNKVQLKFELTGHSGLFELHCPGLFSETCLFDSNKVDYCNVTMMLPSNSTCYYNNEEVYIDCSNLIGYVPDPTSGGTTGWSGSEDKDTWVSGFSLAVGKWWNIVLITIGCLLLLIFIIWLCSSCCRCYKDSSAARYYTKKRDIEYIDNRNLEIDNDLYNKINANNKRKYENNNIIYRPNRLMLT
nr:MAG: glycoprotein [Sanya sesamia inferens phasmavirus 1]